MHGYFLSVAIVLCNKMDSNFGANMADFYRAGHIFHDIFLHTNTEKDACIETSHVMMCIHVCVCLCLCIYSCVVNI